ncbi:MAG: pyridoxal phosphate-dependent aminotransferase [Candidatus Bathyarchaeia archaeon]
MKNYISERSKSMPISGIRVIFEIAQKMKDVVRLEVGEPDFDTPKHIKEAVVKALEEGYTHYTSSAGLIELREAIAEKLRRENGISVDPENEVVVTVGASSAINLSLLTLIDPGDEVLIPDPGWPQYQGQICLSGGVPVGYPTPESMEFRPDFNALENKITEKTKVLIVNSPNNPTGAVLTKDDLEKLAAIAERHDLIVISDEVYEKFLYEGTYVSFATLPGMEDRTLTVNGFSKTYAMTGWRLGYVAGREEFLSQIAKMNLHVNSCPPAMTQRAALTALQGSQEPVKEMFREYRKRRDVIVKGLNEIEGVKCLNPGGAFYVFPNLSAYKMPSMDLAKYLIEKAGVATVPGVSFGKEGEGHLRLSYANSVENIMEAIRRMSEALKRLG